MMPSIRGKIEIVIVSASLAEGRACEDRRLNIGSGQGPEPFEHASQIFNFLTSKMVLIMAINQTGIDCI